MIRLPSEILADVFPFLKQNHALVDEIAGKAIQQSIQQGVQIYWDGDACSHIGLILEGEIRVYKAGSTGREITLYEIGPGETCILNASCILSNTKYPANAVTLSKVDLLMLPSVEFQKLIANYGEIQKFVFTLLSQRLAAVMTLLEEVVFNRMDDRLLDYIIEKSENNRLETTHQNIANDLGTSREVVSRLLKDMERKNKVRLARNSIELLDVTSNDFTE